MHQGSAELMESIFCGKRIVRTVLVLQKYCLYFRDFVGICFSLVLMWKAFAFCHENCSKSRIFGDSGQIEAKIRN